MIMPTLFSLLPAAQDDENESSSDRTPFQSWARQKQIYDITPIFCSISNGY